MSSIIGVGGVGGRGCGSGGNDDVIDGASAAVLVSFFAFWPSNSPVVVRLDCDAGGGVGGESASVSP